jgi:Rrf2 family transcriptional regulator, iron-sulfur cluster assembly transcription factor
MKLNSQIRYGVRALCDIVYYSAGSPAQVKDISSRQNISPRYIEQIFQKLKKGGILRSVRGPTGGYFLARKPEDISVGDVVRAIDGIDINLVFCGDQKKSKKKNCERYGKCVISDVWGEASKRLMDYFNSVTVNDVCRDAKKKGLDI